MAETKGITVKVDADLHEKVKAEQEALAVTLSQYIEMVINEHFEKGGKEMSTATRTLAVQISEDLFQRVKIYLAHYNLKQKDFIIDLIKDALEDFDDEQRLMASGGEQEIQSGENLSEDELGEETTKDRTNAANDKPDNETEE